MTAYRDALGAALAQVDTLRKKNERKPITDCGGNLKPITDRGGDLGEMLTELVEHAPHVWKKLGTFPERLYMQWVDNKVALRAHIFTKKVTVYYDASVELDGFCYQGKIVIKFSKLHTAIKRWSRWKQRHSDKQTLEGITESVTMSLNKLSFNSKGKRK